MFNPRLVTSLFVPPQAFKDFGVVANNLRGSHYAMVKCNFVVNRTYKTLEVVLQ